MPNADFSNSQVQFSAANAATLHTASEAAAAARLSQSGNASDQVSKAEGFIQEGAAADQRLSNPLADHTPFQQTQSGGDGIFSGVDFFQPGIAYISLEVAETVAKSGMELIAAEGELRSTQITDFQTENQQNAKSEEQSIRYQSLAAVITGGLGLLTCAGVGIKLGFDVYSERPQQKEIDGINKQIGSLTDELKNPSVKIEGELGDEGDDLVDTAASRSRSLAADPDADLEMGIFGDGDREEEDVDAVSDKGASDPETTRDEIKRLKGEREALQGKLSAQQNRSNTVNQGIQMLGNSLGKIGEAGAQFEQSHYAYLRDLEGGEKQTTSQLMDAIGSTYSQTTQFVGSAINQAVQNFGTLASIALRLA